MLTYQVRPRIFRCKTEKRLSFPNDVDVRFHLKPLQPFGMETGGGRTAIRAVAVSVLFNANSGEHTVESNTPLKPLDVKITEPTRTVSLQGNVLSIKEHFRDLETLHETIQSFYFALPMLLNVEFADPPYVERVDGLVGGVAFGWELSDWRAEFMITTQENQESIIIRSWERIDIIADMRRRRLLAAIHYFHIACRLARSGNTPGEFLAEVLLNLAKTLEALFPPAGNGRTRDAVRIKLRKIGYTDEEIEGNYIPAMTLRNEFDVGHVELSAFKTEELQILHSYADRAENAFRDLLGKVLDKVSSGGFQIESYNLYKPRPKVMHIIEQLRHRFAGKVV